MDRRIAMINAESIGGSKLIILAVGATLSVVILEYTPAGAPSAAEIAPDRAGRIFSQCRRGGVTALERMQSVRNSVDHDEHTSTLHPAPAHTHPRECNRLVAPQLAGRVSR